MKTAKTQVRLPAATHQWIVKAASENNRSMNGEIVRMLNEVIEREKEKPKPEAA
ncbi:Arc family DNA-binding protein [Leucothrix mucor]|uniref:Arc family DNA-binding protein n=1 Tax=Leucothrix mucor TaxID=45248 RepID=UPI0003B4767B|nr:Arc family DNA-binding protein [Leucothrix mucor]